MEKQALKKKLDVAAGRVKADLVIKNCKVVNVFSGNIQEKSVAICDGVIAGVGEYSGENEIDACVPYAVKAEAVEKTLRAEAVTNLVPATLLKTHPDFILYLDRDSAARILSI